MKRIIIGAFAITSLSVFSQSNFEEQVEKQYPDAVSVDFTNPLFRGHALLARTAYEHAQAHPLSTIYDPNLPDKLIAIGKMYCKFLGYSSLLFIQEKRGGKDSSATLVSLSNDSLSLQYHPGMWVNANPTGSFYVEATSIKELSCKL